MNLTIDIGNTVAKLVAFSGTEPVDMVITSNKTLEALTDFVTRYSPRQCGISSVIPLADEARQQIESMRLPYIIISAHTPLPIQILYKTPETLGSDRMAAVMGAQTLRPNCDLLVIDAGSCITYDFLDAQGNYWGGNISPGLEMRLKAMNQFTARLPLVNSEGDTPAIGYNTETALRAGVMKGIEYEIEGYIHRFQEKYPNISVFLTGGNSLNFDSPLKSCIFADKFLVPRGINRILQHNDR